MDVVRSESLELQEKIREADMTCHENDLRCRLDKNTKDLSILGWIVVVNLIVALAWIVFRVPRTV